MGGSPTAMENYMKYQEKLPAQKVGFGAEGEMLAAPASTPKPAATGTPNAYSRESSKPASFTSESEQAIEEGLK
jgi:hypothetical protein